MEKVLNVILVILVLSGTLAVIAVGGSSCSTLSSEYGLSGEAPKVGRQAPDFVLPNPEGVKIRLSDFRGKPVVINFWATTCHYCIEEMPLLQEVYAAKAEAGLVLLAVNSGESGGRVAQFIKDNAFTFTVLLDRYDDVLPFYRVSGLPVTFFIDAKGVIRGIKAGAFTSKGQIENYLAKIMP
jgi:cytochrome c biogenesis protein CcmG, thiol:disulfide interchange protein DsbE